MKKLHWPTRHGIITFAKYALAGGVAVAFELELLHMITTKTAIWYIYASIISSLVSFAISFTLRKLWVFNDRTAKDLPRQLSFYLIAILIVIGLNTLVMSSLVEHLHWPYVQAQFCAGLFTGIVGFVMNKFVTFRQSQGRLRKLAARVVSFFGV